MVPYQLTPAADYLNLVIFIFIDVHQLQYLLSDDVYSSLISVFSSKSEIFTNDDRNQFYQILGCLLCSFKTDSENHSEDIRCILKISFRNIIPVYIYICERPFIYSAKSG